MHPTDPSRPLAVAHTHANVQREPSTRPSGRQSLQSATITHRAIGELKPNKKNARTHSKRKINDLAAAIKALGFIGAVIVDEHDRILAGHARHAAAQLAGMPTIPTICVNNLSEAQMRAFVLADNKFAERAGWNRELLAAEIEELSILLPELDLNLSLTGFEAGEIDFLLTEIGEEKLAVEDKIPPHTLLPTVSKPRDLWKLGKHRLLCDDSRREENYARLVGDERAAMVFADPPFNVPIAGHVQGRGRVQHCEFAFASGEMSQSEFRDFLTDCFAAAINVSQKGAIHYVCMDWRHIDVLMNVGRDIYDAMLNLVVWNKTSPGQGSFYRSQHELIGVFRVAGAAHQNNIELGRFGRNRSNVWSYTGVNSFGANRTELLASHPTVKPVALVADAIKDCTCKGQLVLDPFMGSGTTILAAERVGRRAFGIEYEPAFTDVAIRRWQDFTKSDAILEADGRTFDEVAQERLGEPRGLTIGEAPPGRRTATHDGDWVALCATDDKA